MNIWFISDTHFFHSNSLKFQQTDGTPARAFSSVEEMNEYMMENWNENVKPSDKVYHLGDVALQVPEQHSLTELLKSLHGHKRLMLGNHDNIHQHGYRQFERIELWTGGKFKQYNFVASHLPLRKDQMRKVEFNVHGHVHQNSLPEKNYLNVCVEVTNYRPVHLDEILEEIKKRA